MRALLTLALPLLLIASLLISLPIYPTLLAHMQQPQQELDDLIRQLGDPAFQKREAATAKLMQRRDAVPALKIAATSNDAEVAHRARKLLGSIDAKWALPELKTLAKQGKVDQAVEKLVRAEKWGDEIAAWQVMADLAARLCELEKEAYGKTCFPKNERRPVGDIRRFLAEPDGATIKMLSDSREARKSGWVRLALRAQAVPEKLAVRVSYLAVSGDADANHIGSSVIFAGGSVRTNGAQKALVVCDGDFSVKGIIDDCLIIARGDVHIDKPATIIGRSHVISSRRVHIAEEGEISSLSEVNENQPNPLGFVRFFDPAVIGFNVEKSESGVKVKDAPKEKPFGAAGLRPGDIILTLDGKEPKDPETFRRLLRPKVVENEEMLFRVRRGNKTLEIKVQVPEEKEAPGPAVKSKER
jgi:hypothetical protein